MSTIALAEFQKLADRMQASLDCHYIPDFDEEACVAICGDFSAVWLRMVIDLCLDDDKAAEAAQSVCMKFTPSGMVAYWPKAESEFLYANPLGTVMEER